MAQQQRHRPNTKKRRRGRHPGLYKALSTVLILGAVAAACIIFFRVSQIEVLGNSRYTVQEIIDIAGVKPGDNLFAVRSGRISQRLQSRLPYVRSVSVRRRLPNTLTITVTEGQALAAVAHEGKWWLLDEDGKLLEQASSPGGAAPVTGVTPLAPAVGTYLAAGEEEAPRVERLRELLGGLAKNGLAGRLDRVDLAEDYRLTFSLDERFTVHISPTLEKGMDYWLQRLREYLKNETIQKNQSQSYTVEIMDDQCARFIPDQEKPAP